MIPMPIADVAEAVGATVRGLHPQDNVPESALRGVQVDRVVTDSRIVRPGDLFVAIRGPRHDGHAFVAEAIARGAGACLCDRDPFGETSRPMDRRFEAQSDGAICLMVPDTVAALGRLAAHYRRHVMNSGTVVIAVTGTNGKTTAKAMIDHVLRSSAKGRAAPKSFNNAIGVPLTILSCDADDRYLIVEIGSNAPGEVAALAKIVEPAAAVITAIGEAHLEGLGDLDGIAAEKASLLDSVHADGLAVVNVDQPVIRRFLTAGHSANRAPVTPRPRIVTVGCDPGARLHVAVVQSDLRGTVFELDGRHRIHVGLPGAHHAANAAVAFAVARWFGVAPEQITEQLRTFEALPGRGRTMDVGGVLVVDDSYNANPSSMTAAIDTLSEHRGGRRVFVLGDMLELGGASDDRHRRVVARAAERGIEVLVTVGPAFDAAVRTAEPVPAGMVLECCDTPEAAGDVVTKLARVGDAVWIKGSRAMGLERAVDRLVDAAARMGAVAPHQPIPSSRETAWR